MTTRLRPVIGDDSRQFWQGVDDERLRLQHCEQCQTIHHPPVLRCRECGSFAFVWHDASGRGTVFSYGISRYPATPQSPEGTVHVVVELEEGVRIVSNLVRDEKLEAPLEIGAPVEVLFDRLHSENLLPLFQLVARSNR